MRWVRLSGPFIRRDEIALLLPFHLNQSMKSVISVGENNDAFLICVVLFADIKPALLSYA